MSKFEGFEPANTTPVPDILFDELLSELTGTELKVLLYIIRRTSGFKKATDAISLSQLQNGIVTKDGKVLDKGCGVKRRDTIVDALASLEKKGCIMTHKGKTPKRDHATTIYSIRFKGDKVVTKPDYPPSHQTGLPLVTKPDYGSHQSGPPVVTKPDPQETVIQQTVIQECTKKKPSPSPSSQSQFLVAETTIGQLNNTDKPLADYTEAELRKLSEIELYALLTSKQRDILQRWRSLFKKAPVKLDGKLARALHDLEECDPSAETLEQIRRYCFSIDKKTDKFPKGYYGTRGVKLWDVVEHYADWQQTQTPPEPKTEPKRMTIADLTSRSFSSQARF